MLTVSFRISMICIMMSWDKEYLYILLKMVTKTELDITSALFLTKTMTKMAIIGSL